jgi:hypothetical protein
MAVIVRAPIGEVSANPKFRIDSIAPGNSNVYEIQVPSSLFSGSGAGDGPILNASLSGSRNLEVAIHPDTNGSGVFELNQDGFLGADTNISSSVFPDAHLNTQGFFKDRHFVVVNTTPGFTASSSYTLRVSATPQQTPPNLAAREIVYNAIQSDITISPRRLDFRNDADNHAFTLGSSDGVNIRLFGLDADCDLRVIRDKNSSGVVESGEVVASSTKGGTQDDLVTVKGPGSFIAQVYLFARPVNTSDYQLQFDHFTV